MSEALEKGEVEWYSPSHIYYSIATLVKATGGLFSYGRVELLILACRTQRWHCHLRLSSDLKLPGAQSEETQLGVLREQERLK